MAVAALLPRAARADASACPSETIGRLLAVVHYYRVQSSGDTDGS
jgi:hypothetical protein